MIPSRLDENLLARIVFTWVIVTSVLVQFIILPFIIPERYAGHGLIEGGDWVGFYHIALDLADRVREYGWKEWELRPELQAPSGIAAAFFVVSGIDEPYVMLPLNATLFTMAVVELHRILRRAVPSEYAWVGVIPLVVFPSSIPVFAQLHKDVFSILGIFLVLNSLWLYDLRINSNKAWFSIVVRTFFGLGLIWIVRPYLVNVVMLAWWLGFSMVFIRNISHRRIHVMSLIFVAAAVFIMHAGILCLANQGVSNTSLSNTSLSKKSTQEVLIEKGCALPDCLAQRLSKIRKEYIKQYPAAGLNLDPDTEFNSFYEWLQYLPRAIQVGYFSPFPVDWFDAGNQTGSGLMHIALSVESIGAAAAAGFLAYGIIGLRKNAESYNYLMAMLVSTLFIIVILASTLPNLGTLSRMRLAPWHILIGLGLVIGVKVVRGNRSEK